MSEDTIAERPDPSTADRRLRSDPFTNVLRDGARKLIEQAIHAELTALMASFSGKSSTTVARGWCAMVTYPNAR